MTTKRWDKLVARDLQAIVEQRRGFSPPYTHCLRLARKYENDENGPNGHEEFAAYIFGKEYP